MEKALIHHFQSSKSKIWQKSMFLVPSATSVIGIKYLYVDRAQNFFSKMLRFRHQGYQMKALLKVDEEYQVSDISRTIIGLKFDF